MKKFVKYIFVMLVFLGFTNGVSAKDVLMNCSYYAAAGDSFGLMTQEVNISCDIYDDYSHGCLVYNGSKDANRESIVNYNYHNTIKFSVKDYIKENNKCPDKMVFVGSSGLNGYRVYLADDDETLKKIKEFENSDWKYIKELTSTSHEYSNDETEKCYSDIVNYTNIMNSSNLDVNNCADSDKVITRYSECKSQLVSTNTSYRKMKEVADGYLNTNCIDSKDKRTVAFYDALKKFQGKITDFETDLDKGDCDIKTELGLECEKSSSTSSTESSSTWNKTDGNTLALAKRIYDMLRIIIPLLVIILSIVDFLKVILLSDDKNYKATWSKFIKRIIIGIIFFAVPALITLLLNISGLGDNGILNVFA